MKLLLEPMKNPVTGRISRKSATAFVSFSIAILLALSEHFAGYELNQTVFNDFLILGGGSLMLSSAEKVANHYHERKKQTEQ